MTISFHIQRNVWIANTEGRTRRIRHQFLEKAGIAVRIMEEIHDYLLLPPTQKVVIRDLSGCHGAFHISEQTILIDPKQSIPDFVRTFCHECVHAEQYFTRRFTLRWEEMSGDLILMFDGSEHKSSRDEFNRTDSYYDYPWEQEAYFRQEILADAMHGRLGL